MKCDIRQVKATLTRAGVASVRPGPAMRPGNRREREFRFGASGDIRVRFRRPIIVEFSGLTAPITARSSEIGIVGTGSTRSEALNDFRRKLIADFLRLGSGEFALSSADRHRLECLAAFLECRTARARAHAS